jgi:tetratricopeptide (TPR) repeat protein
MEGQSKEIGRYASYVFVNAKPSSWIETNLAGDTDFGFDYQVQVKDGDLVKYTFRAQLKGTTTPNWIAEGSILSFSLDASTLNMYANTADPTLLVVCVVPKSLPRPYAGDTYFVWVNDALSEKFAEQFSKGEQQETYSIHIPAANRLTPETDLTQYLQSHAGRVRAAASLSDLLGESLIAGPASVEPLQLLESSLASRPNLAAALIDQSEIWPAPAQGTAVQALLEIAESMRHGAWERAAELHGRVDSTKLTDEERAEYLFLDGRLLNRKGQFVEAEKQFEQAHYIFGARDIYLVAAIEAHVAAQANEDPSSVGPLIARLEGRKSTVAIALRARLLFVSGDTAASDIQLKLLSAADRAVPTVALLFHNSKFEEAIAAGTVALEEENLQPRDRALLLILRARCRWYTAIGPVPNGSELPLYGSPRTDVSLLKEAWIDIAEALPTLKSVNWPISGDIFADMVTSVALTLGHAKELFPAMMSAAEALPWSEGVQRAHETLCMALGRIKDALLANSRLQQTPSNLARRVGLLSQAEEFSECAALAESHLTAISQSNQMAPIAIGMAAAAAAKCNRPLVSKNLIEALSANPGWQEYVAFFREAIDAQRRGNDVEQWTKALKRLQSEFPDSGFIAQNLISNLNPHLSEDAETILQVAALLRTSQSISFDDTQKTVRALLTLRRWPDALQEANDAIDRFGASARLLAMRAIALDSSGKTAAALAQFEEGISTSDAASELLHAYLGVCLRLSMFDAAKSAITSLLERARNPVDVVELKRLHLIIAGESAVSQEEYVELLRDFAATVDQNDSEQEAVYLSIVAHAAYVRGVALPAEMTAEFAARRDAYSVAFPESKQFTVIQTSENADAEELLKSLEPILGDWRTRSQEYLRRERELRDGRLPIAYITRAGFAIHYIGDPLTLWEVGKAAPADQRQFLLTMQVAQEENPPFPDATKPPALDLTALMVLDSLNLLDVVLRVWKKVAVGQLTISYLSQLASSDLESSRGAKSARRIMAFIREHVASIEQPRVELPARVGRLHPANLVQEVEALNRAGYCLYADDELLRLACKELIGAKNSFCTLDFLRWAEERGHLPIDTVCQAYVQLCTWHVAVRVPIEVFLAPLTGPAASSGSFRQVAEKLGRNELFTVLSRAVWWPDKDFAEMLGHISAVVIRMLGTDEMSDELVAAVWGAWLSKIQFANTGAGQREYRAASLFHIASQLAGTPMRRAWNAYKATVELEYGERMDKAKEKDAVQQAAAFSSTLSLEYSPLVGEKVVQNLQSCMVVGTEEAEWFSGGLLSSIKGLAQRERQVAQDTLEAVKKSLRNID